MFSSVSVFRIPLHTIDGNRRVFIHRHETVQIVPCCRWYAPHRSRQGRDMPAAWPGLPLTANRPSESSSGIAQIGRTEHGLGKIDSVPQPNERLFRFRGKSRLRRLYIRSPGPRARLFRWLLIGLTRRSLAVNAYIWLVCSRPHCSICAQAQRDSIRTSVRRNAITRFDVLFITAPFK